MAATVSDSSWAATPSRAFNRTGGDGAQLQLHDGERCRALLLLLLREVAAFARQQQARHARADASLWVRAVAHVCDARIKHLQTEGDGSTAATPGGSPRQVVAEAMVQELLVSLSTIRLAETETLVLDEVENAESLRRLRQTLQQEEQTLRRVVRDGADGDAQLAELQRLLRGEFVHELAQSRAQELADSVHNEASLQFAWETIQDQKHEIVRLRAEHEQLKATATAPVARHSADASGREPIDAIHQLQLQLSSHPDTNLRILQSQLTQLEDAMVRDGPRASRRVSSLSDATVASSRDDAYSYNQGDSVLLPSHLASPLPLPLSLPSECAQCRRHARTLVECQSELKQLRAQGVADEDALVRAEKAHLHMKREHAALTAALLAAKHRQEELRQMVLDITDAKLQLQSLQEAQQRTHDRQVDVLTRQLRELEAWRERSEREQRDAAAVQQTVESEVARLKEAQAKLLRERHAATADAERLRRSVQEQQEQATVETAKATEAMDALRVADTELGSVRKELQAARHQLADDAKTLDGLRLTQRQLEETQHASRQRISTLEKERGAAVAAATRLEDVLGTQNEAAEQLQRELSRRDAALRCSADELHGLKTITLVLERDVESSRADLQRLRQRAAELEGRLDRSEEQRSEQATALDQAAGRVEAAETERRAMAQDLQRQYEECQRLEEALADARAESVSLQTELADAREQLATHEAFNARREQERDGLVASTRDHAESLTLELSETKTTILMWMSKFHAVVDANAKLKGEAAQLREEAHGAEAKAQRELQALRDNYRALAEDKEKVLVELERSVDETLKLTKENARLADSEAHLHEQVQRLTSGLKIAEDGVEQVTAERNVLETETADLLSELGELEAAKRVLTQELVVASKALEMVEDASRRDHAAHENGLQRVKGENKRRLDATQVQVMEAATRHQVCVEGIWHSVVRSLDGLDARLQRASQAWHEASQRQRQRTSALSAQLHAQRKARDLKAQREDNSTQTTSPVSSRVESTQTDVLLEPPDLRAVGLDDVDEDNSVLSHSASRRRHNNTVGRRRDDTTGGDPHGTEVTTEDTTTRYVLAEGCFRDACNLVDGAHLQKAGATTNGPESSVKRSTTTHGLALSRLPASSPAGPSQPERVDDAAATDHVACETLSRQDFLSLLHGLNTYEHAWTMQFERLTTAVATVSERVRRTADNGALACRTRRQRLVHSDAARVATALVATKEAAECRPLVTGASDVCTQRSPPPSAPTSSASTGTPQRHDTQIESSAFATAPLVAVSVDASKASSCRRASAVAPALVKVLKKPSRKSNAASATVALKLPARARAERGGQVVTSPPQRDGVSVVQGDQQETPALPCHCSSQRAASTWVRLVGKLWMRSARRSLVVVLAHAQHAMHITRRFTALVDKTVAASHRRRVLAVAAATVEATRRAGQLLTREAVEQRALLRWTCVARAIREKTRRNHSLIYAAKTLRKQSQLRSKASLAARAERVDCSAWWQQLRWRLELRAARRDAMSLLTQCLALKRDNERLRSVERPEDAGEWGGTSREPTTALRAHPTAVVHHSDDASTALHEAMRECVTLLRRCFMEQNLTLDQAQHLRRRARIHSAHAPPTPPPPPPAPPAVHAAESVLPPAVDLHALVRLLLESSRQVREWKDAIDRKLREVHARDAQLTRLESHCAALQAIVDKYRASRHAHETTQGGEDGWWLASDHPIHGAGHTMGVDPTRRALETERRRLNQRSIEMLERVIAQLRDAKVTRVLLDERLHKATQARDRLRRYYRGVCIENVLLRAFYEWRFHTLRARRGRGRSGGSGSGSGGSY